MYDLSGKVALVTGAGGRHGIGRSIALRLAEEGADVTVTDIEASATAIRTEDRQAGWAGLNSVVEEIETKGRQSLGIFSDVSDGTQVADMVAKTLDQFGKIDILVNNAGIIHDQLLMRMSDDAWHSVIGTNLNGTFYCTRAVLRGMVRNRWGRIINIGSVVGERGNPGQANYTASKAGIIGFTKALSKEVATRNITVNTVNPGYVETDTTAVLTEQQTSHWLSVIPQGKFGEADDIAHMVIFLAQEKAKYITGQVICVDGGMAV